MGKRKRFGKRAYLNRFSQMRVPSRVDSAKVSEYNGNCQSISGPRNQALPILNNTFTQEVPQTGHHMQQAMQERLPENAQRIGDRLYVKDDKGKLREVEMEGVRPPRAEIHKAWKSATLQGFDTFRFPVLKATCPAFTVYMLMNGNNRVFHKVLKDGSELRSHIYPRDVAERVFETNRISGWRIL